MRTRHDFAQLDPSFVARDPLVVPTGHEVKRHDPRAPDATLASAARSARQALDQHADLARADVRVTIENGMLILRGRVQNEKLKEQAEDAVEAAASGIKLQNYLIVDPR